jgi:hypothetical protein
MENTALVLPTGGANFLKWTAIPVGPFSGNADGGWIFDNSTGVLTYTGSQPATYELSVWASVSPNTPIAATIEMTVDVGGTLLGQTTSDRPTSLVRTGATLDSFSPMATSKVVSISPGQTVRAVFREIGANTDILVQMSSLVARRLM